MDIYTTIAERNRMRAAGASGSWRDLQTAIKQRVVDPPAVFDPIRLPINRRGPFQVHPIRGRCAPILYAEANTPVVVVRKFKQIDWKCWRDYGCTFPIVFFQINKRALFMGLFGNCREREALHVEWRSM